MPPLGTALATWPLNRIGVPTSRASCSTCCATGAASTTAGSRRRGSDYEYTSAGAVKAFIEADRLRQTDRVERDRTYRYERDVEQFFRHSPAVVRDGS